MLPRQKDVHMDIPVFVSCPTSLSPAQESSRSKILKQLEKLHLAPRALGRSDYPTELPLREVFVIAKHCAGGVILGFEQFRASGGTFKPDAPDERVDTGTISYPTPWNHLEAGILFGLGVPLLIFREPGIAGGVFDPGVTDVFVNRMPTGADTTEQTKSLNEVFLKWQASVRVKYYER